MGEMKNGHVRKHFPQQRWQHIKMIILNEKRSRLDARSADGNDHPAVCFKIAFIPGVMPCRINGRITDLAY